MSPRRGTQYGARVTLVQAGAATDVGLVRAHNEDSLYCGRAVFGVADGMGGHAAGDVASAIAVAALATIDEATVTLESLRAAVTAANSEVLGHVLQHPDAAGMGTTVAGLALLDGAVPHWAAFNVGDSRVYGYRDGELTQLTVDHSEVEEMVAAGLLSRLDARRHPARNIITRAIGEPTTPDVDILVFPVGHDSRYVVCSDGLTSEVGDEEIAAVLSAQLSPEDTAAVLVRRANELGGRDNISVIVVEEPHGADTGPADGSTNPRGQMG